MNVLIIYRSGIAYDEFNETYNRFKDKYNVYAIVENEMVMNYMIFLYKNITFYTKEDLLKDKISMKFDYIIGNPPYQNKDKGSKASSLYIDITKKVIPLLTSNGIIDFLTPTTIAQVKRTGFQLSGLKGLKLIDYTADKDFNVGIKILRWKLDLTYSGNVKVIDSDGTITYRNNNDLMVESKDIKAFKLFEKIKENKNKLFLQDRTTENKYSKLFIGDQTTNGNRQEEKTNIFKYKVIVNYLKNKIEYSKTKPKSYGETKLVIHMGRTYNKENILISKEDYSQYQNYIVITNYSDTEIENLKSFLFNEISIAICKKYRILYKTGMNNILYNFPKIDLSKKYTNKDVQEVFNLTDDEVKYLLD